MEVAKEKQIVDLIKQGYSERKTAELMGCGNTTVHKIKVKHGLCGQEFTEYKITTRIRDSETRWKLMQRGFECVDYVGRHHPIKVRCLKCGSELTRDGSWTYLLYQGKIGCPVCKSEELRKQREAKAERIRKAREEKKAFIKAQKQKEKEERQRAKMQEIHICECCGRQYTIEETGYNSAKYCSERCQKRFYQRKHDQVRDHRKRWRKHDSDITLEKVFKRDKGICHICGGYCDWSDFYVNDNETHIAGNGYPSIDHVFPLSKGGTDTWDNVKLAHRICNSHKRDKIEEMLECDTQKKQ